MSLTITHDYEKPMIAHMEGRGLSRGDMLHGKRSLDLKNILHEFETTTNSLKPMKVKVAEQRQYVQSFKPNPLSSFRVLGISSIHSDLLAKQVAVWFFGHAFKYFLTHKELRRTRTAPLWHRVFGGLGDRLLDSPERPSFLVISNVTVDSTNYKVEKVRDLLEKYSDIPRIVVIGGDNPVSFFRRRLYYPIDAALLVGGGSAQKIQDMDL